MYKLIRNPFTSEINQVQDLNTTSFIPFAPGNTDYEKFKMQINDETAQLEDADGILMTPEQAIVYVATLP